MTIKPKKKTLRVKTKIRAGRTFGDMWREYLNCFWVHGCEDDGTVDLAGRG